MQGAVVLHFEYVRMATDEESGRTSKEDRGYGAVVLARIATDVGHQYVYALQRKTLLARKHLAKFYPIDIAKDGTKRLAHGHKAVSEFGRTDVASVPHFIARGKMVSKAFIP